LLALYASRRLIRLPPSFPLKSLEEANFRELAGIMEILREGGYHVELEKNIPLH
jgi:hypothetical protein